MRRFLAIVLSIFLTGLPVFAQGQAGVAVTPLTGQITASSTACATAASCVWQKLPANASTAAVTLAGTWSGTVIVEGSADGGNTFTTLATYTTTQTAIPFAVSGFTDIRVRCSTFSSGVIVATLSAGQGAPGNSGIYGNVPGVTDPCLSPYVLKSSVPINITSAATANLVSAVAGKAIYVCGFALTISQVVTTSNTLQFLYSSVSGCGSGTTALTGLLGAGGVTASQPIVVTGNSDGTEFTAPIGTYLCTTTAIGATGSFQGYLSFVQQ